MKKWREDSDDATALRVTLVVSLLFTVAALFAFPFVGAPLPKGKMPAKADGPSIVLVDRLSDAQAAAGILNAIDTPPPQTQTDFLPANLSNSAQVGIEQGFGSGFSSSNSSIVVDQQMGTLQITGDGGASAGALSFVPSSAVGSGSAKLISLSFILLNKNYSYTLGGQLSVQQNVGTGGTVNSATAKLTGPGGATIFEVVADHPPAVTLSENGILPPGDYIFSVEVNAFAQSFNTIPPGNSCNSSANFTFALDPAALFTPTPTPTPYGRIVFQRFSYPFIPPSAAPTPFEPTFGIYMMNADGTNPIGISSGSVKADEAEPKWSFDGSQIAFTVNTHFGNHHYIEIPGSIFPPAVEGESPAWAPDGSKLVFSRDWTIWVMNPDGTGQVSLQQQGGHPSWSPDGTKIVFDWSTGIWVMNTAGGDLVNLSSHPNDSYPCWSPDGKRIAFVSGRDGTANIFVMNADGSNQTRLTNNNYVSHPSWSPDGTRIAFASLINGYSQVYLIDADGSNESRILTIYRDADPDWERFAVQPTPTLPPSPTPETTPTLTPTPSLTPTGTPTPTPGVINLVSRLSDARASAFHVGASDTPPPQIQTDFLPANLNNSAGVAVEQGSASGNSSSNSSIVADTQTGTLQISGDGSAGAGTLAFFGGATGTGSAKLITINFTLSDGNHPYSLTGQLFADQMESGGSATSTALARLSKSEATIFELMADHPPAVTLSEKGILEAGDYILTVEVNAESQSDGFISTNGSSSNSTANFNFSLLGAVSTPTPAPTLTPTPTPTPTVTLTPTATPTPMAHAVNLSTRLLVGTGTDVGIAGFIITGTVPIQVAIRGIGPSLGSFGVPNVLADPFLELRDASGALIAMNDNWCAHPGGIGFCCPQKPCFPPGITPKNTSESVIVTTLEPGAYTAILSGKNGGTGVGLVELYDLTNTNNAKMANISTRGLIRTSPDFLIAGFIIGNGSNDDVILIRGLGPSLSSNGVSDALVNPTLDLHNSNGEIVVSNDDWQNGPPISLPPSNPLESAIETTLSPGSYTAVLSGVDNGTGVGLVEVYDRGAP